MALKPDGPALLRRLSGHSDGLISWATWFSGSNAAPRRLDKADGQTTDGIPNWMPIGHGLAPGRQSQESLGRDEHEQDYLRPHAAGIEPRICGARRRDHRIGH